MGIISKIFSKDNYVNIESINIDFGKKTLRIRTRIYNNFGDQDFTNVNEHLIDLQELMNLSTSEAEKMINMKELRKEIELNIELDKKSREAELLNAKHTLLFQNKKKLGKEKLDNLFKDLDNTRKICYEYLQNIIGGKEK